MSDADKELQILIKTKADLDGAKAAGMQLDQDTAKAQALGDAYDELGNKLSSATEAGGTKLNNAEETQNDDVPVSRDNFPTAGQPSVVRDSSGADDEASMSAGRDVSQEANTDGEDVLSLFQAGVEGLRTTAEALSQFFGTLGNSTAGFPKERGTARTHDQSSFAARGPGNSAGQPTAPDPEPVVETDAAEGAEMASPFAESHAQAIQSSGERIRAALEANTRSTVSLFNRTLELIGQQNRELGEVDRKLTELSGQIKSLKNV